MEPILKYLFCTSSPISSASVIGLSIKLGDYVIMFIVYQHHRPFQGSKGPAAVSCRYFVKLWSQLWWNISKCVSTLTTSTAALDSWTANVLLQLQILLLLCQINVSSVNSNAPTNNKQNTKEKSQFFTATVISDLKIFRSVCRSTIDISTLIDI